MKRKGILVFLTLLLLSSLPVSAASLSKKKLTLYAGRSFTLEAKNFSGAVTWKSSDKTIATVTKNGKVKAKAEGTAVITGLSGKQEKSCTVTVKPVKLSKVKKTLVKENTFTLKLYCGGTTGVKWTTSDQSIVKIKEKAGNVVTLKGLKKGKATITATFRGVPYECAVKVKKATSETPAVPTVTPTPTPSPTPVPTQEPVPDYQSDVELPEIRL